MYRRGQQEGSTSNPEMDELDNCEPGLLLPPRCECYRHNQRSHNHGGAIRRQLEGAECKQSTSPGTEVALGTVPEPHSHASSPRCICHFNQGPPSSTGLVTYEVVPSLKPMQPLHCPEEARGYYPHPFLLDTHQQGCKPRRQSRKVTLELRRGSLKAPEEGERK